MMAGPGPIVADLRAESDDLDALVTPLPADRWADATPAPGWTIAHQIAHLLWTDRVALTAVTDESAFAEVLAAATADPVGLVDAGAEAPATAAAAQLVTDRRGRRDGRSCRVGRRRCRGTGDRSAGRVAHRLAGDPRPVARGAADGRRRSQVAVVRAADECGLDGDRAVDGDLGAWT